MNYVFYIIIIVVKTFEVTLATLRMKLITKGQEIAGSIVGFFEIIIWLVVVSFVLKDITADPFKVVAYAIGFTSGNYLGSILEERIGLGTIRMEIIIKEDKASGVTKEIRDQGFAVTVLDGEGRNFKRKVLLVVAKRKQAPLLHKIISNMDQDVFITMTEIKPLYGGYGTLRK